MSEHKRKAGSITENTSKRSCSDGEYQGLSPSTPSSHEKLTDADKSLSDYTKKEKARWRANTNHEQFLQFSGWPDSYKKLFRSMYPKTGEGSEFSLSLVNIARGDLSMVEWHVSGTQAYELIAWSSLQLTPDLKMNKCAWDKVDFNWLKVKAAAVEVREEDISSYVPILKALLRPSTSNPATLTTADIPEAAFHIKQERTPDGHLPSTAVYHKIVDYYNSFNPFKHLSPHASVVGSDGIGKSYMLSQMAITHGIYVIYTNFSPVGSSPYPERTHDVASRLPAKDKSRIVFFWECYITASLLEAEVCRMVGISPEGFYNLQTMQPYRAYGDNAFKNIQGLLTRIFDGTKNRPSIDNDPNIRQKLREQEERSRKVLAEWKCHLDENGHNTRFGPGVVSKKFMVPDAIFCIDEAHSLLDSPESLQFFALRKALRKRFRRHHRENDPDLQRPLGDFFATLLDGSLEVARFQPPEREELSLDEALDFETRA